MRAILAALPLLALTSVAASRPVKPNVVVVVSHDFAFDMPASIPAGLTTLELRNRGKVIHHLGVVRVDSGHTAAEGFAAIIKAGRGVRPSWLHPAGGPQGAMPGQSSTVTLVLEPGSYVAFCEFPGPDPVRHYAKGMMKAFTVTPPSRAAALPSADVALRLVDFDFIFSRPLTRGRHVIAVTNSAAQPHMVAFKRFPVNYPPGTAAPQLAAWAQDPKGTLGPGINEGGVMELAPGQTVNMTRDFSPGMYLLICFTADATDGKPHFKHGMQKEITIR